MRELGFIMCGKGSCGGFPLYIRIALCARSQQPSLSYQLTVNYTRVCVLWVTLIGFTIYAPRAHKFTFRGQSDALYYIMRRVYYNKLRGYYR